MSEWRNGRRARLRGVWRNLYGFKSRLRQIFYCFFNPNVSGLERNWQACRLQLTLQSSRLRQIFYCFFNLNVSGLERNWQACRLQLTLQSSRLRQIFYCLIIKLFRDLNEIHKPKSLQFMFKFLPVNNYIFLKNVIE